MYAQYSARASAISTTGLSAARPAGICVVRPKWIRPRRNVPAIDSDQALESPAVDRDQPLDSISLEQKLCGRPLRKLQAMNTFQNGTYSAAVCSPQSHCAVGTRQPAPSMG